MRRSKRRALCKVRRKEWRAQHVRDMTFRNDAVPDRFIISEGLLSPSQQKRFKQLLASSFTERPEDWPGQNDMLDRIIKAKEEREAKLAAMTPEERAAWIEKWAHDIAAHEVAEGIAYDRWARGEQA